MVQRFYPQHLRRERRRLVFAGVGLVLFVSLGAVFGFYHYKRKEAAEPTWETYTNEELRVSLVYPSNFEEILLSEESKEVGVFWEIRREDPPALFNLRFEDGLGPLKMLGGTVFEALAAAVNRRYPDRFPDYKKENYEEFVLANEKAALFDFTYTGADGKTRVKQRFVIVVKDDAAYYLSCQSPEKEFFQSEEDCDRIIDSFEFLQ